MTTLRVFNWAIIDIEGRAADHWCVSVTVYTSIVISTNIAVFIRSRSVTWLLILVILFTSVVPYFLFMYWYDRWDWINVESTYSASKLFFSPHFYLCVAINCMYVVISEVFHLIKYYRISPTLAEYFKLLIKRNKDTNPSYFNEKILREIKKYQNPLELRKANTRILQSKNDFVDAEFQDESALEFASEFKQ